MGYHGVPLIKDIELSVKKGEILTLIGPNGAGKDNDSEKYYPAAKASWEVWLCWMVSTMDTN